MQQSPTEIKAPADDVIFPKKTDVRMFQPHPIPAVDEILYVGTFGPRMEPRHPVSQRAERPEASGSASSL